MVYNFNISIKGGKIEKDKINYILSYLHVAKYIDKTITDDKVPLNIKTMKKVIGPKGIETLYKLKEEGYITNHGGYKKGLISNKWSINYDKVSKKGIKLVNNKYSDKAKRLKEGGQNNNLDYTTQFINETTKMFFNQGLVKFLNVNNANKVLKSFKNESSDKYWAQKALVDKIMLGDIFVATDTRGARVFSNHSNLAKELRNELKIEGEDKISIDIKNSQIQTLCIFLNEKFPKLYNTNERTREFFELVNNGEIYDFISNKFNYERKKVKKDMLNWLYAELYVSRNKESLDYINRYIKARWSDIHEKIELIKDRKEGGKLLSHKLQMMEAKVVKEIQIDMLKRGITCITLHDSFYFKKSIDKEIIKEVIERLKNEGYGQIEVEKDKELIKNNNNINLGLGLGKRNIKDNTSYGGNKLKEEITKQTENKKESPKERQIIDLDKLLEEKMKLFNNFRRI
jgi:hypothetical protein